MLELEKPCAHCAATGTTQNLTWTDWYAAKSHETLEYPAGPEPQEPEEIPCSECEGTGRMLTEDGQAVAVLVQRIFSKEAEQHADREDYAEERRTRAATRHERDMQDMREQIEREQWAREDLETKLRRGGASSRW